MIFPLAEIFEVWLEPTIDYTIQQAQWFGQRGTEMKI